MDNIVLIIHIMSNNLVTPFEPQNQVKVKNNCKKDGIRKSCTNRIRIDSHNGQEILTY